LTKSIIFDNISTYIDTVNFDVMKNNKCCLGSCNCNFDDNFEMVVSFLKIVSEPNRLKILCLLRHGEQCVCDIWKNLDLPQNLTSHHLKKLKDFGLIESRQEGRRIIYRSNKKVTKKYASHFNNFLTSNI